MTPFDTLLPASSCRVVSAELFTAQESHWLYLVYLTRGTRFRETFCGPTLIDLVSQLTTRIGFGQIAATEIIRLAAPLTPQKFPHAEEN